MTPSFGTPSKRSATGCGRSCQSSALATSEIGIENAARRSEAMRGSTHGASTSAAMKPSTTDGSEAIISIVGFTAARMRGCRNSEV